VNLHYDPCHQALQAIAAARQSRTRSHEVRRRAAATVVETELLVAEARDLRAALRGAPAGLIPADGH